MTDPTIGTGIHVPITQRFVNADVQPPAAGEHLWTVFGVWKVNPNSARLNLDTENLLSVRGPLCFVCAIDYAPDLPPCSGVVHGEGES